MNPFIKHSQNDKIVEIEISSCQVLEMVKGEVCNYKRVGQRSLS